MLFTALLVLLTYSSCLYSETLATREYKVKTAFLYNFVKLASWPNDVFSVNSDNPFIIGVYGSQENPNILVPIDGKEVKGKKVVVQMVNSLDEINNVHMLFVLNNGALNQKELCESIKNEPILTVADKLSDATRPSCVMGFYIKNNKIRFSVNLEAAKQARLNLGSQLLSFATVFKTE